MITCRESCQSDFFKTRNKLGNPAQPGEWGTKTQIHRISVLLLFLLHVTNPNSRIQTTSCKLLKRCHTRKLAKMQKPLAGTRSYITEPGQRPSVPLSIWTFFQQQKEQEWHLVANTRHHKGLSHTQRSSSSLALGILKMKGELRCS